MKKLNLLKVIAISAVLVLTLASCGTKKDPKTNAIDEVTGYNWVGNDDSLIELSKDGTFMWYRNADVKDDYYYEGTYEVYNGDKAVEYIANDLSDYGVTAEAQQALFDGDVEEYTKDNYYCLVLSNDKMVVEGENTLDETFITPYLGFYYEDEKYLDIANMNTNNYHGYTRAD